PRSTASNWGSARVRGACRAVRDHASPYRDPHGRRRHGSPCISLAAQVLYREPLGIRAGLGKPDLALEQPQSAADHVAGALVSAHRSLDDPLILLCRSEADGVSHNAEITTPFYNCHTDVEHGVATGARRSRAAATAASPVPRSPRGVAV